ncbi:MAG: citrate lyase holo-[acyl-carrier protein] synthase [Tissierellaceae bacterium]
MIDEKTLNLILKSREDRRDRQIELIDRYNMSLISFTLNIPGSIKDSPMYREIHAVGVSAILRELEDGNIPVIYKEEIQKITGPEAYIVVDMNPIDLKRIAVKIEEYHPLGRILDIDVFDSLHNQIGRTDLKANPRGCLLCDNDARICMRMQAHSYEELVSRIERIWEEYNEML